MQKGDIVYYARIIPNVLYEICELKVRTVTETYFVGIEKETKQSFLFSNKAIDREVFYDRKIALNKVKEAEKAQNKFYEE